MATGGTFRHAWGRRLLVGGLGLVPLGLVLTAAIDAPFAPVGLAGVAIAVAGAAVRWPKETAATFGTIGVLIVVVALMLGVVLGVFFLTGLSEYFTSDGNALVQRLIVLPFVLLMIVGGVYIFGRVERAFLRRLYGRRSRSTDR